MASAFDQMSITLLPLVPPTVMDRTFVLKFLGTQAMPNTTCLLQNPHNCFRAVHVSKDRPFHAGRTPDASSQISLLCCAWFSNYYDSASWQADFNVQHPLVGKISLPSILSSNTCPCLKGFSGKFISVEGQANLLQLMFFNACLTSLETSGNFEMNSSLPQLVEYRQY
jgi:hypothetical protein